MNNPDLPITPKASNEVPAAEVSGTWSRDAGLIDASPYLNRTGWKGFWPLDDNGWMMRPSIAAQTMIFRAIPGIVRGAHQMRCEHWGWRQTNEVKSCYLRDAHRNTHHTWISARVIVEA